MFWSSGVIKRTDPARYLESGRGQPHSKTLARFPARYLIREVLECGCPLPLYIDATRMFVFFA
jgi:hypothetical protein